MEIKEEIKEIIKKLPDRPLLRPDEVASTLGITKRTVYNWVEQGKIMAIKLGTHNSSIRIYKQSLINMLNT